MSDLVRQRTSLVEILGLIPNMRFGSDKDWEATCDWREYYLRFYHSRDCIFDIEFYKEFNLVRERKLMIEALEEEVSDDEVLGCLRDELSSEIIDLTRGLSFEKSSWDCFDNKIIMIVVSAPEDASWKRVSKDLRTFVGRIQKVDYRLRSSFG